MSKSEASTLAKILGWPTPKSASAFFDQVSDSGLTLAVDNDSGDWVVLDGQTVKAKCA